MKTFREINDFSNWFLEDQDQYSISTIKGLVMDATRKANSGHPGGPMSCADFAYILYRDFLNFDPTSPEWFNRDRFVLSGGHMSMLQYSLLLYIGWLVMDDIKSFRGFVSDFAYWNKSLEKNEIKELNDNSPISYLCDDGQYNSSKNLKIYYDFKHIKLNNPYQYDKGKVMNLTNPRHFATSYNCIPKSQLQIKKKKISIPARRKSTFKMIRHIPQGYIEGGWKTESTRLNQIQFYNQILENKSNLETDGLTTLKYTTVSDTSHDNYTMLSVKLDI